MALRKWVQQGTRVEGFPTIHIVSDGSGATAATAARASASKFEIANPTLEVLSEVTNPEYVAAELRAHIEHHRKHYGVEPFVLFYTTSSDELAKVMKDFIEEYDEVVAVDVLGETDRALMKATGKRPTASLSMLKELSELYFKRIEAIEFTIAHDDGRKPEELTEADIVLIGVSRTSKTPTSIYLAQLGYKVANIPLDPLSEPPAQIYDVDPSRLFGLMTVPEILVDIRKRRLGNAGNVASSYADYEQVCRDLEKARALMRKLGCIVVRTDNRAIEETSQEILRYYTNAHHSGFSANRKS